MQRVILLNRNSHARLKLKPKTSVKASNCIIYSPCCINILPPPTLTNNEY